MNDNLVTIKSAPCSTFMYVGVLQCLDTQHLLLCHSPINAKPKTLTCGFFVFWGKEEEEGVGGGGGLTAIFPVFFLT